MTKQEIIIETKEFYAADTKRRGVRGPKNLRAPTTSVNFYYVAETGCKCAVGRCLTPEGLKYVMSINAPIGLLWKEFNADRQVFFEPKYRGHDAIFWTDIQRFHDRFENWDEKGITATGLKYFNEILEKHSN
jgi:hypothetical protein